MVSPLVVLPAELFLQILSNLHPGDLVRLISVSRQYQDCVEPYLYSKIELHQPQYHERFPHRPLQNEEDAVQRPYQVTSIPLKDINGVTCWYYQKLERIHDVKATKFLGRFTGDTADDAQRIEHVAGWVRWLCLPVEAKYLEIRDHKFNPWDAIAKFTNLEYLEISGYWKSEDAVMWRFVPPSHSLPKLKTLKLRGYVPKGFVQFACRHPENITELQLAVLDVPIHLTDGTDLLGGWSNDASGSHYPKAPHGLACLDPGIISRFSSLTRLSLLRPAEAPRDDEDDFIFHSVRSDIRLLNEWASLLRAAKKTLTHVTFEQQPVVLDYDASESNDEFMRSYSHGPGYRRFVEIVLPVLLETGDWPVLQSIRLFGFELDDIGKEMDTEWLGEADKGVDLVRQMQRRFPGVEVTSWLGKRMLFDDVSGRLEYYEVVADGFTCSELDYDGALGYIYDMMMYDGYESFDSDESDYPGYV